MFRVGLGHVEDIDTRRAVAGVIEQCRQQLGGHQPKGGIVFACVDFDHELMLADIKTAFPGMALIGCTTAGEFSTGLGFSDDSICLMAFASDRVQFKAGLGRSLSSDPEAAVTAAVEAAKSGLDCPPVICLALPDVYDLGFDDILHRLYRELCEDCSVFGGCAGTQWQEAPHIYQFYNHEVLSDSIPVLLMAGELDYRFTLANSWQPLGRRARVGRVEGCRVYIIDDMPAVEFYRHYLGAHDEPAHEFTLAVYETGRDRFYLRAPMDYHIDGSITFSETVPVGATVQLTEAIRDIILKDTQACTRRLVTPPPPFHPAFAMAFSCAFRKEILGTQTDRELQALQANLPAGIPIGGFYSFGEIAPFTRGRPSVFHGATLVTLLVGEKSAAGHAAAAPANRKTAQVVAPAPVTGASGTRPSGANETVEFLKRKLSRSEYYRSRLETVKDFNASLHRKIITEVDEARREIDRQQAALKKSEEKHRRIVETAGEGFVLMDQKLIITDLNAAYCQLVGYTREELIGRSPLDLATDDFRAFMAVHREELFSKDYRQFECHLVHKKGRHIPVLIHGNTLRDDAGEIIGNMAFVTDMSAHKKALALAAEVQKSLLPQENPRIKGLDIAGRNVSCEEIGGDYYDFLSGTETADSIFSVIVGDITGHGVDSALLMTSARAFLRMRASQPGSIADVVTAMNRHLAQDVSETGRFMTLFFMSIDPDAQAIHWVRAGHDPALLFDPACNSFEELKGSGMALGVDDQYRYPQNQRTGLTDGQVIAIGTDGIWEAFNQNGEMFGKRRFQKIIADNAHKSAADMLTAVFARLDDHTRGVKTEDDITLVIVKVMP